MAAKRFLNNKNRIEGERKRERGEWNSILRQKEEKNTYFYI